MQRVDTRPDDFTLMQYSNLQTPVNGNRQGSPHQGYNLSVPGTSQQVTVVKRHASDMDSESEDDFDRSVSYLPRQAQIPDNNGPKPGKKTKGRVKIKMEFIENKLRRYTTFSKRKTGIMKKAYELSTLTGTQVMLLVASETGHVYTFATRKLQPMITSESGKALIQTCLNSPDQNPVAPGQQHAIDQRMNPTGFEETDLTYAVTEEENLKMDMTMKQTSMYGMSNSSPRSLSPDLTDSPTLTMMPSLSSQIISRLSPVPSASTITQSQSTQQSYSIQPAYTTVNRNQTVSSSANGKQQQHQGNVSMQLPTALAALLPGGATLAGTQITLGNIGQLQNHAQTALLRIPTISVTGSSENSNSTNNLTPIYVTGGNNSTGSTTQAQPMMYQTPQGIVYAAASGNSHIASSLPEGYILNLPQTPTTITLPGHDGQAGTQQFLTFPLQSSMLQLAQQQQGSGGGNDTAINLSDSSSQKRK